ncbi:hypothetical protein KC332_g9468 [Hortaea werneckii]|nr:hypothetical protein KC329_g9602 [Hortaea werneckii]KAI7271281.1 hypothetical protein KC335_g5065 [Hortaea werneckii]KAI7339704.1 hypothetical protein KC354_g17327 [Hortaea werneckii]KAI7402753.1 hypothetical protein KC332_g9468 [Hortaea werneckii]KAI7425838.1 hypothetical protein KC336_g6581 [Hortaea werneckii]
MQAFGGLGNVSITHGSGSNVVIGEDGRPTIARGNRDSNTADKIEDQLRHDGHLIWGFVLYRCTYGNDGAWKTCVKRLNESIRGSMRFYNGLDLLEPEHFKLTIFDDESRFNGASAQVVRQHFRHWRSGAIHQEQGSQAEIEARGGISDSLDYYRSVRYRFCVQIDEVALQTLLSPEGEDRSGDAWVNLIKGDWVAGTAAALPEQGNITHADLGLDSEDYDDDEPVDGFPEIDGCTEENVGLMRVHHRDLIPDFYSLLRDPNAFEDMYVRPPELAEA